MIVTTTPAVQGRQITDYLGIVVGEAILGANVFRDVFAGITDIMGGRSGAYEKSLGEARETALRELEEELVLPEKGQLSVVGMVNDESNPVGSVHFGLVHLLRLETPSAEVREKDQLEGKFVLASQVKERVEAGENFETWSSLVAARLDEILTA